MKIGKLVLKPIAYLAGLHASGQARRFLRAHQQTRACQDSLMKRLVQTFAPTDFGRDHGLARVRTYADFVSAVPISSYEAYRPYIQRCLEGQTQALVPPGQKLLMFSLTSGTTGRPKHIPVTQVFAEDMKRGWNAFGMMLLQSHTGAWLRPILQISSPMRESVTPTGLPCGAVSGLLAVTQKKIVRHMYVVPPEVAYVANPGARYYVTLRCGVGRDVAFITTANPSSTIKLIEVGQEHAEALIRDVADGTCTPPDGIATALAQRLRFKPNRALARRMENGIRNDGQLLPRHFWNIEFLANWTGGTLKLYLRRLRELFGGVPIRDIGLLASEGRFSVPIADNVPAGIADITSSFIEFVPIEQRNEANPVALRADEVEVGREYMLVFSNWSGLFRYNLDDCVRVVDRYGQSPVIEFLYRGGQTANITGEKVTEHQVVEAMREASARERLNVERFTLQGRFASVPFYQLAMDELPQDQARRLAEALDRCLCNLNIEYQSKRKTARLGPIQAIVLPPGSLAAAEQEHVQKRRGRLEQYKHQYLLTDVLCDEPQQPASRC